jgi:hypothetical protein
VRESQCENQYVRVRVCMRECERVRCEKVSVRESVCERVSMWRVSV